MTTATATRQFVPSEYQQAIFDRLGQAKRHIQISAVAGSGKTTTLIEGLRRVPADVLESTLLCAFNKEIQKTLAAKAPDGVTVKTNHGIGYGALALHFGRGWRPQVQTDKYERLTALYWTHYYRDEMDPKTEGEKLMPKLLHFVRVTLTDPTDRDAVLSMAAAQEIELPADRDELALLLNALPVILDWGALGRLERDRNGMTYGPEEIIDFDDMLWLPNRLGLRLKRYRLVMVDECQDLNAAQLWLVLNSLASDGQLCAVGDPRQAIYAFTGADAGAFDRIREATGAELLPLSICYRCPRAVIDLAKTIVPELECAPNAPAGSVDTIKEATFCDLVTNRDMVLCRVNAPLITTAFRLIGAGRPAKVRGRDIGASVVKTLDAIEKLKGFKFQEFLTFAEEWRNKQTAMARQRPNHEALVQSVWDKADCAVALYMGAAGEGARSMGDLRARVVQLFTDEENGHILLSSIHKAKGLEAGRVFILRPDKMPHPMAKTPAAREQEYNLQYVAYTRAMSDLFIVQPDPESL
jgi:DNA helicase-2/ATP-dependent DNA helicase PcrA